MLPLKFWWPNGQSPILRELPAGDYLHFCDFFKVPIRERPGNFGGRGDFIPDRKKRSYAEPEKGAVWVFSF